MSQSLVADPEVKPIRNVQTPGESIVVIRELSKIYKQGDINVTALDRISLDIAKKFFFRWV